jgi:hypothetical protein
MAETNTDKTKPLPVPETPDEALEFALDKVSQALIEHLNQYRTYVGDWRLTLTLNDGWEEDQAESRSALFVYCYPGYGVGDFG